jgi:multimeric flavodoxin WrbA
MKKQILGIVGSYRKGGAIDILVTEVLAAAHEQGAETEKIYLVDKHIEFCANCRTCTQIAGTEPGKCIHDDDMQAILTQYKEADGLVIGAPVNFFNLNAMTRRFMERLICFAWWPWGQGGPTARNKIMSKNAVLITSCAMPTIMGRFFTGALRALKFMARTMGAKPVTSIFAGMIAQTEKPVIPDRTLRKARAAGCKLAMG